MKEEMEANQRAMEEMTKSWEQKLQETKDKEAAFIKERMKQEMSRLTKPHLVNLNEDALLDRKVVYDIDDKEVLSCGRRKKGSEHKMQIGGSGV